MSEKALARIFSRKLEILFPNPVIRTKAERQLARYGKRGEPQVLRCRLALLKLSEGNADEIERLVEGAKEDYFDMITHAESQEMALVDESDWMEYIGWIVEGLK